MFSRSLVRSGAWQRRVVRPVSWVMAGVLGASLMQVATMPAEAAERTRPTATDKTKLLPDRAPLGVHPRKANPAEAAATTVPARVSWPAAGATELTLPTTPTAGARTRTPDAVTGKAGGLSVSVSTPANPAATAAAAPGKVRVEVLDRKASERVRADGPVVRVTRTDGVQTGAKVRLGVGYAGLAGAFGGDFGPRLRLASLPECALTTPEKPQCAGRPLPTLNDSANRTVSAEVSAVPAGSLLAMTAGDASSQGDYGATKLAPSSKWSVAPSTGGFSWSYPLRTPPVPGGNAPSIALAYSSQAVDGRTAATNNQGSWIGEGFNYEPGHIERRYKPCSEDGHDQYADQCWAFDNATILLNGKSTELVKTGEKTYRFAMDDGSKVRRETGAVNGDDDGEYWVVTTVDGTEYHFGLNRLPGWTANKEETGSTWTLPVFGDDDNEPCHRATFLESHCDQAWRWSLDYVKDRYGNVTSYFYHREINHYARGGKTDVNGVPYVRGGWLKRIDYGQRHNQVYTTNAPARVRFTPKERCLPTGNIDCDPQDLTPTTAPYWPDVPFDRNCAADTRCKLDQITPTFWTRARLTAITTEIRGATDWSPVDEWKLDHLLTDNGDGSRTLWLQKITHKGLVGDPIELPAVELGGLQLPNRIDTPNDNISPLVRFRLATVWTDTGGQVDVNYKASDCSSSNLPSEGNSTRRCYPVKWNPLGSGDPITDWFHKYVVEQVVETDRTGGAPDMVTRYDYLGGAAWRHAEPDGISDPDDLTWSEWRGYGKVEVTTGDGQLQTTKTEYRYLRGMHGDKKPGGGTRDVSVADSTGVEHVDHDQFSGHQLESITFDGANEVSKSISAPWRHNTATQTFSGGTRKAWFVNTAEGRSLLKLADGSWRETKNTSTFETSFGRVTQTEHHGDVAVTGDESCTRTTYADNATRHYYNLVSQVESVSVRCSATPNRATDVLSDTRTLYDGGAFGVASDFGNPTRSERLKNHNGTTASYARTVETTFDSYGRPKTSTDALGRTTTTDYTETNGLTTRVKQTSPLGHETTTEYAPAWGQPVRQTDPNTLLTRLAYDALGRVSKVWLPDRAEGINTDPSIRYSYLVQKDKPVAIKTERRQDDDSYSVEYKLHDGLLRPRQIQSEGPNGTRMVADTFYTGTGKLARTYATYNVAGTPTDSIYPAYPGEVDGETRYLYDGADRVKAEIFAVAGNEKWRTTTTYDGERTSVDPPQGGTPTTTVMNALGQTTHLLQYKGGDPSGPADTTSYTYTKAGHLDTVTDPAGNVWRHKYDQLGRRIETIDPDAGTSTVEYDDLDRVTSTVNGVGARISTTYDEIGRKVAVYRGTPETGEMLSSWIYDLEVLGQLSIASRWIDGAEYATYYTHYDWFYRPNSTFYQIPDHAGAELAGLYQFTTQYNSDGTPSISSVPEAGGLPMDTLIYRYDNLERLTQIIGDEGYYLTDVDYSATGEVIQTEAVVGSRKVWSTYGYEQGSKRLTHQRLDRAAAPVIDIDAHYTYDPSGNILQIANNPSGTRDTQCFTYDYLRRMDRAWTSASTEPDPCAGGPSVTGVGGAAPYHHAYTFDVTGNRKTETQYAANGTPLIERSYSYPAAGQAQPHTLQQMTEKTPSGDRLYSYEYDAAGNTKRRTKAGEDQTLVWDAEGNLESVTDAAAKKTSYLYDVDGSRMLRKEPNATTLYLPGMEIRLDHQTRSTDATCYYVLPGGGSLVRKVDGFRYVASDHHGTGQATVDEGGAVTHRRLTPFGESRGAPLGAGQWPTEKGFVNGNIDTTTGLVNIGAREYDTVAGRFVSVDPIIDVNDPQQMNGYAYANNNPVSFSDPDGLKACSDDVCGPGADYVDSSGNYHNVPGHNDGCNGCSGAYDPDEPSKNVHNNPNASAEDRAAAARAAAERERQRRIAAAKAKMLGAAKALAKILMDELGITDALDCFLKGDMGGCLATAANVAGAAIGGALGKLAARYGAPWKWKKLANLTSRVKGLLGDLIDGVRTFLKKCDSFAPGTLVLMADGSRRPIEKLKPGDRVLATDPDTGRTTVRAVVATHINLDVALTDLTLTTAAGSALVETTANHPFWSQDRSAWVEASQLRAGESLLAVGSMPVSVSVVRPYTNQRVMYNLTIDDIHTYYVMARETPVLVHNDGISMDDALDRAAAHVGDNPRSVRSGSGGVQFMNEAIDADGNSVRRIARFDVNPNSAHVQKLGPHLNLETQVNGRTVTSGPLKDPHLAIDPSTIRSGDYC